MDTPEIINARLAGTLPGILGVRVTDAGDGTLSAELEVQSMHMAPNGYLHAASIIALADTTCGYGTLLNLPSGASNFTTIELKSNFTGTARDGLIECIAKPLHLGRSTQLWDAVVRIPSGKTIAQFRCTQMLLWPR